MPNKNPRSLAVLVLALVLGVTGLTFGVTQSASAVSGSLWDPGYIISDSQFYNAQSMSEADIQNFFSSHACSPSDGVPCLKNFSQTTSDKPDAGTGHCAAYSGAANESAARIVSRVAIACGISPRVLLVLMQKEQSLVSNPSASGYQEAMGWGCPDTGACDPNQQGFFNQVYKSAWQFRQYTLAPGSWNYKIGVNQIAYSPNACGTAPVNIRNQATANLYIYTPYQPNAAALANMYGTGDVCSTYGNRNFWRIFYDWFGNPADSSPIGQIENMQPVPGGIGIWGWALDTDTPDPIYIHVYSDGQMVSGQLANSSRPDVGSRYGLGDNHGIGITVPLPTGTHTICIYAINVAAGSNLTMGCWSGISVGGVPIGSVDNIQPQPGGLGIWGWALDPDTTDPVTVNFTIDGARGGSTTANVSRDDIAQLKPGYGINHAFGAVIAVPNGTHRICGTVPDLPTGTTSTTIGCYTVTVSGNPFGSLDTIKSGIGTITVSGWAIDPDTSGALSIQMSLDGQPAPDATADQPRNGLGAFSSWGSNHGFTTKFNASPGLHTVCAAALNQGPGSNVLIGCQTVQVGGSPIGVVENAQLQFGAVGIWGWTYDPDTADNNLIHVYIDGVMSGGFGAVGSRPDVAAIPDDYGDNHGFAVSVPLTSGTHQICVYAINVGYGTNTLLRCVTATASGNPVGAIENVQPVDGGLGVWGYALDPDSTGTILVHAYLDGVMVGGFGSGVSRDDLATRYPGYGPSHAYGFTIPANPGTHSLCVYGINVGPGSNVQLGCLTVTR